MKLKNLPARCGKICLAGCPVYLPLDKHITKRYVLHLEHLLIHFDFCSGLYSKNISFDLGGTLVAGQWFIAFVDAHLWIGLLQLDMTK